MQRLQRAQLDQMPRALHEERVDHQHLDRLDQDIERHHLGMAEPAGIAEGHPRLAADDQVQPRHDRVGKNAVRIQMPADPERQQHQAGERQADAEHAAFGAGEKRFMHAGVFGYRYLGETLRQSRRLVTGSSGNPKLTPLIPAILLNFKAAVPIQTLTCRTCRTSHNAQPHPDPL